MFKGTFLDHAVLVHLSVTSNRYYHVAHKVWHIHDEL